MCHRISSKISVTACVTEIPGIAKYSVRISTTNDILEYLFHMVSKVIIQKNCNRMQYNNFKASNPNIKGLQLAPSANYLSFGLTHLYTEYESYIKIHIQGRREGGKTVKPYQAPSLKKASGMVLHAPLKILEALIWHWNVPIFKFFTLL